MNSHRRNHFALFATILLIASVGLVACSGDEPASPTTPAGAGNAAASITDDPSYQAILQLEGGAELLESIPELQDKSWCPPGARLFLAYYNTTIEVVPPFPPPTLNVNIWYDGIGTMLGRHTGYGASTVDVTVIPNVQLAAPTMTGANGDELDFDAVGIAVEGEGEGDVDFEGSFDITGGTGRFAGATGSGHYRGSANTIEQAGRVVYWGYIVLQ